MRPKFPVPDRINGHSRTDEQFHALKIFNIMEVSINNKVITWISSKISIPCNLMFNYIRDLW